MSKIMTNQLKIAVLIYCENNCANWSQAMQDADYTYNYANNKGWELLGRKDVKVKIQAFIDKRRKKANFNREQSELELNLARERAIIKNDIPSEIAAIREKNAIFALRTENINTGDLERLKKLSEQEALEAKRLATIRLRGA